MDSDDLASAIKHLQKAPPPPGNTATSSPTSPRGKRKRVAVSSNRTIEQPPTPPPRPAAQFLLSAHFDGNPNHPHCLNSTISAPPFPSGAHQLILDTGASVSVSPERSDFVGPIQRVQHTTLQGIAAGLPIAGTGTVRYTCTTDAGEPIVVNIPDVLFVPTCPSRLICPRQLLGSLPGPATATVTTTATLFSFSGGEITVPYHTHSKLPVIWTSNSIQAYVNYCGPQSASQPALGVPANLTPAQLIKLRWHNRLNHMGFDQLTSWMRNGTIDVPSTVTNCPNPICGACLFGKAKRRPHTTHRGSITAHHTTPGAGVSADQFEAGVPGIVPTTKGLPTSLTYKYCNFWGDHCTRFIYVIMHPSKDGRELLKSKSNFESFCRTHGVNVHSIRADNGVYSSDSFQTSCSNSQQQLSLCGVGSHWQNGLAERAIGTIQATARTILLHAMAKWPTIINESFWPFAIRHSVHLYNISSKSGLHQSSWELFTGTPPTKHPSNARVFGCPAFVLHKTAQDNPSCTKTWSSRSWQEVYVGFSPLHASTVAMIYNPATKHVTPQFHVTFDEEFSTVLLSDPITLEERLQKLSTSPSN
jgi:hypothetical protein